VTGSRLLSLSVKVTKLSGGFCLLLALTVTESGIPAGLIPAVVHLVRYRYRYHKSLWSECVRDLQSERIGIQHGNSSPSHHRLQNFFKMRCLFQSTSLAAATRAQRARDSALSKLKDKARVYRVLRVLESNVHRVVEYDVTVLVEGAI